MKLQGKVAGITGGGDGFGRAMALAFAREGADVAVCDVNLDTAEETASLVDGAGRRALRAARGTDTPTGAGIGEFPFRYAEYYFNDNDKCTSSSPC